MGRARPIHVTCRERKRPPQPRDEGFWRDAVARWERSGLSRSAFCEGEGLRPATLLLWARKLASAEPADPAAEVAGRESGPASASPLFLPVRVVRPVAPPHAAPADLIPSRHLEVQLAGGRRVRVDRDFDAEALARLVVLLERLPCC